MSKIKFLFIALIIINVSIYVNAQNISVKGGLAIYSFYETTFHTGEVKMSPTPIAAVNLNWQFGSLFSLSWENAFRFKFVRADFIGVDTVTNKKGTSFHHDFNFFNIDSKVLGIFSLMRYDDWNFFAVVGTGISVPLNRESDYYRVNPNVVLSPEYYEMKPDGDPTFFWHGNILTEAGIGANYRKISLTANFLTELFEVNFVDVGTIRTSFIQINIGYNF